MTPLPRRLSFALTPIFAANQRWPMAQGDESSRLERARRASAPAARSRILTLQGLPAWRGALVVGAALAIGTGLVLAVAKLRARAGQPPAAFAFDPDRVAYFEAAGWRAYYDRRWLTLLRLIVGLCQEQFRIPFPVSLLAAYDVTRAAAAWAPADHDPGVVQGFYEKFYRRARRYSGLAFDPARAAALELQYNDVHRRLVGQSDQRAFVETLAELHATLFGISREQARESAEQRVAANTTVDGITSQRSTDVDADWAKLEEQLRQCYRSIQRALARRDQTSG